MKTQSFSEIDSYSAKEQLTDKIKKEIENKGKEYILGVDEEEYIKYLVSEYTLEPLVVNYDSETIDEPNIKKEWIEDRYYREKYQQEVYVFTISYSFIGSAVLFRVRPSSWTLTSTEIYVDEISNIVSFSFELYQPNPQEFNRTKLDYQKRAFTNINNVNTFAAEWTNSLHNLVATLFKQQKEKYKKENDFFTAINICVNKNTTSVFTAPTIKKKIVPLPTISNKKEFSSEPTMSSEMYNDILKVIYDLGKSMEKKPATYQNKEEEAIRDQFLLILETRYDSTTATGETFNKGGKTDIILKYANDGTNLFVAECKFWHGASEFHKAISQLFDRYLTWRDSKTALLLFVKNKEFTSVIETIKNEVPKHPYFTKIVGQRGETSFSYIFHLPNDSNKNVFFEIIAFHYDK